MVRGALRRAGAGSLEDGLPDGLATRVGSRFTGGHDLSGGQWQRLALARGLMRGTITVLVSHRFSTVRATGLIVVLQDGRVLEHGSHPELLAAGGAYAELFELQARAYR